MIEDAFFGEVAHGALGIDEFGGLSEVDLCLQIVHNLALSSLTLLPLMVVGLVDIVVLEDLSVVVNVVGLRLQVVRLVREPLLLPRVLILRHRVLQRPHVPYERVL